MAVSSAKSKIMNILENISEDRNQVGLIHTSNNYKDYQDHMNNDPNLSAERGAISSISRQNKIYKKINRDVRTKMSTN